MVLSLANVLKIQITIFTSVTDMPLLCLYSTANLPSIWLYLTLWVSPDKNGDVSPRSPTSTSMEYFVIGAGDLRPTVALMCSLCLKKRVVSNAQATV